jgi:hypothetical protein
MEKWLALLGNIAPVLRKCGYVALCVFLYWFGGHNVTERQDAVQSAVNTVTSTLTTRLQTVIDGQVGTINDRLKGDTNAINQQYKTGMAGVDRDYHDLLALPAQGCTSTPQPQPIVHPPKLVLPAVDPQLLEPIESNFQRNLQRLLAQRLVVPMSQPSVSPVPRRLS